MTISGKALAWAPIMLLVGACSAGIGPAKAPEGETDLSCAASIFAATNLLDGDGIPAEEMKLGNYVAVMTKYGTAYAKSEGIGANEVLAKIKIEAYRITGTIGGGSGRVPNSEIVASAKKCAGA